MDFEQLQGEVAEWAKYNFPKTPPHRPLMGAAEEIGELCHAQLKLEQHIRGSREEHIAEAKDAVADCIIYLSHYCSLHGFNLQALMEETWGKVKQRDWQKDAKAGGSVDG